MYMLHILSLLQSFVRIGYYRFVERSVLFLSLAAIVKKEKERKKEKEKKTRKEMNCNSQINTSRLYCIN